MLELVTKLVEEPEKTPKKLILIINVCLNLLFAERLYVWFVGRYSLIDFLSIKDWISYVISGRILLSIFFYFLASIILFQILAAITTLLIQVITNEARKTKLDKNAWGLIFSALNYFEVISIDKTTNSLKALKYTQGLYEFVEAITNKEDNQEILSLKNSFLNDIIHGFFVFIAIFYSFINVDVTHNRLLGTILFILTFFMIFAYVIIDVIHAYIVTNHRIILIGIKNALHEKQMLETFNESGFRVTDIENSKASILTKKITVGEKSYAIMFYNDLRTISESNINRLVELNKSEGVNVLLVTNKTLSNKAVTIADNNKDWLEIIEYVDEKELVKKIQLFLNHD